MFYRGVSNKNGQNLAFYPKFLAETVGFEPTCRLPDNTISSRARYDLFDTSP